MHELRSIVVGVDFSDCSRAALRHGLRLAASSGAPLYPVHVVDMAAAPATEASILTVSQYEVQAGLVARARAKWEATVADLPGASGLELQVRTNARLEGLRREIVQRAADLLVIGARGVGKPNVGLGSLASQCLLGLPIDVLIVRDNSPVPFRTVVAGIDFSSTSRRALEAAVGVARSDDAKLYAVHVVRAPDGSPATITRLAAEHGPALEEFTAGVTLAEQGVAARLEVFPYSGHRSGLLEFCACVNADLLAIGTRGTGNLRDLLLGSTAEKVVRDSVCAVWAARPRE